MKAVWLFIAVNVNLAAVATYCPEKCLCLWFTDHSLTINCSGSDQTEVPYGIDPQVKILDLSHNEISSYNHSRYLKAVEQIDLFHNKITEAYFGGSFKHLQCIDLSFNYVADLGKIDVEKLPHLRILNLSHNTKLRKLSGLRSDSLEYLNLSHCFVSFIDERFLENLPNIKSIDFSFNSFQSLTNIRSDFLENLDVSHGNLQNLTQFDIFNLPDLTKLNVSFNPNLKIDFSYENSCWKVKNFDLSNSEITSLDEMFPFCSLEVLNASVNKIQVLEVRTFFNNCELHFVNLSNNRISEVHSRSFFTTDKLKILDLSKNQIQDVDFTIHLKEVMELDLSQNHIFSLVGLFLKKVINLNLSHNKIKEFLINLNEQAPKIKNLNLSFNKIKTLQKIKSKSLNLIDVSYCKISSIDLKAFEGAENLIHINLAGNKLTTLDFRIFKDLENLRELMLSRNEWACNCQAQEFKEFYEFLTVDRPLTNVQQLQCIRSNGTWRDTCLDAWHKEKEWKKTIYSLTVSLTIALIVVAVIFFCKYFNDKKRMEESEREARQRRINAGRRCSSGQSSLQTIQLPSPLEPISHRSSTPPPNYEAALLLPKLTEAQKNLAISTLSIAMPSTPNEEQEGETEENENQHATRTNE